jgi:vancomycin resistance protein YoaR
MIERSWIWGALTGGAVFLVLCLAAAPDAGGEGGMGMILGSCATRISENPDRTKNIALGLERIDGIIMEPDTVFSFNRVVGSRTARRGFLPAPVLFQDKKSIQVGGGICQVSSTLYNAALLADMEILERYRHSSPVTYLPLGLDATVSFGYRDLRFRNPHPFPVMIVTSMSEDLLSISVMAAKRLDYDVEVITEVTEVDAPFPGRASETGKEIKRYRLKRRKGEIIQKEYLGRDYYHPVQGRPE